MKQVNTIQILESIALSWKLFKKHFSGILGIGLIVFLVSVAVNIVVNSINNEVLAFFTTFVSIIIQAVITMGVLAILLDIVNGKNIIFSKMIPQSNKVIQYILAYIVMNLLLFGVALAVVLIAAIIIVFFAFVASVNILEMMNTMQSEFPVNHIGMFIAIAISFGFATIAAIVYINIRFGLFPYAIADKDMSALESLKYSSSITEGNRWKLFIFYTVLVFLNFIGLLFLIVGLIVTIPVTVIASTYVYSVLSKKSISKKKEGKENGKAEDKTKAKITRKKKTEKSLVSKNSKSKVSK